MVWGKKGWLIAVCILFLVLSALLILFWNGERKIKEPEFSSSQKELNMIDFEGRKFRYNRDILNIMFLGIDNESKMLKQDIPGQAGQADTILILSFHKEKKQVLITQIPRDTITEVDLYNGNGNRYASREMQIALQYTYNIGGESSCWATKKTVSELLYNLPVDGYITLDISGIPVLNDRLGGVPICFEEDYTHVNPLFEKGKTVILTGKQAEQFVRYRNVNQSFSNQERMERQIYYIEAVLQKMKKEIGTNSDYYNSFYPLMEDYLLTDLREDQINSMAEYENKAFEVQYLPGEWVSGEEYDEFHINKEELRKQMIEAFYIAES